MANTTKGLSVEERLDILERLVQGYITQQSSINSCTNADMESFRSNEANQADIISKNESDIYYIAMEAGIDLD